MVPRRCGPKEVWSHHEMWSYVPLDMLALWLYSSGAASVTALNGAVEGYDSSIQCPGSRNVLTGVLQCGVLGLGDVLTGVLQCDVLGLGDVLSGVLQCDVLGLGDVLTGVLQCGVLGLGGCPIWCPTMWCPESRGCPNSCFNRTIISTVILTYSYLIRN